MRLRWAGLFSHIWGREDLQNDSLQVHCVVACVTWFLTYRRSISIASIEIGIFKLKNWHFQATPDVSLYVQERLVHLKKKNNLIYCHPFARVCFPNLYQLFEFVVLSL